MANDTPDVSSIPAGSYYANASGLVPVSGNSLSADSGQILFSSNILSGNWYVERQTLRMDYSRVPMYLNKGTHTLNLSANYNASGSIAGTMLVGIMDATYSRKMITGAYYTQTFRQTQKFEIHGLSAAGGVAYTTNGVGTLSAGQLGPAGSIETVQPWYYRRPWAAGDTEVSRQVTVANVAYATSGGLMPLWNHNQRYYFQNYDSHFIKTCGQYHPRGYNEPFAQWNRGYYWLTGGYSVAQEASRTNVYAMLDTMGSQMSAKTLAMVPPTASDGFGSLQTADLSGIAEYDINRHDYT